MAFLGALGEKIALDAGLPERLRAIHEYFSRPADSNRLPLDITQFDQEKVARFVGGVGYEEAPYADGDKEFSQNLFKRCFFATCVASERQRRHVDSSVPGRPIALDASIQFATASVRHRFRFGSVLAVAAHRCIEAGIAAAI